MNAPWIELVYGEGDLPSPDRAKPGEILGDRALAPLEV